MNMVKEISNLTLPLTVLIESVNDHDASMVTGKMDNNSVVHLPGTPDMIGTYVTVRLEECKGFYYYGKTAD